MKTFRLFAIALLSVLLCANFASCNKEEILFGSDNVEHPNGIPNDIPTNIIYYSTNDNIIIRFDNEDVFGGAKIVSNTYSSTKGYGTIEFASEVTAIETEAFMNEKTLTYIALPNSVTSIGERAFEDCSVLTSIFIPNSVKSVGKHAFFKCDGLTSVHISDIAAWCNVFFYNDDWSNPLQSAHHLYLNGEEVKDLVIPNSVTSIGQFAFAGCFGLTSVTIPNCVKSICDCAFLGCTGLTSVTIPNSVKSICDYAFLGCTGLTSVTIPNGVTGIFESAFEDCIALTSVTIPNSVTIIGDDAFEKCPIKTCYSYATNPPSIYNDSFDRKEGILYVPEKSLDAYIHSNWVSNFRYIAKIENPDDVYEHLTVAEKAEGTYTTERGTYMEYVPGEEPFTPLNHTVQLTIEAITDSSVNITLPSTSYDYMSKEYSIPEITIKDIPVRDDLNNGVFIPEYKIIQYEGKHIEGVIAGEIKADGNVRIAIRYIYENIPFIIVQYFIINTEN